MLFLIFFRKNTHLLALRTNISKIHVQMFPPKFGTGVVKKRKSHFSVGRFIEATYKPLFPDNTT